MIFVFNSDLTETCSKYLMTQLVTYTGRSFAIVHLLISNLCPVKQNMYQYQQQYQQKQQQNKSVP